MLVSIIWKHLSAPLFEQQSIWDNIYIMQAEALHAFIAPYTET